MKDPDKTMVYPKLTDPQFKKLKDRIYKKYGCGIDRALFESLLLHDVFSLDQLSFRARNDDGSEAAATWIADVNINWTQEPDVNFRVRFLGQEVGPGTAAGIWVSGSFTLFQYNLNGAGWNPITDTSDVVKFSLSSQFANLDATTQQLGSGTFIAGKMMEANGNTSTSLNGDDETECEGCFQIVGGDVSGTDTIQLRAVGQETSNTVFDVYTSTPTVSIAGPIEVPLVMAPYQPE